MYREILDLQSNDLGRLISALNLDTARNDRFRIHPECLMGGAELIAAEVFEIATWSALTEGSWSGYAQGGGSGSTKPTIAVSAANARAAGQDVIEFSWDPTAAGEAVQTVEWNAVTQPRQLAWLPWIRIMGRNTSTTTSGEIQIAFLNSSRQVIGEWLDLPAITTANVYQNLEVDITPVHGLFLSNEIFYIAFRHNNASSQDVLSVFNPIAYDYSNGKGPVFGHILKVVANAVKTRGTFVTVVAGREQRIASGASNSAAVYGPIVQGPPASMVGNPAVDAPAVSGDPAWVQVTGLVYARVAAGATPTLGDPVSLVTSTTIDDEEAIGQELARFVESAVAGQDALISLSGFAAGGSGTTFTSATVLHLTGALNETVLNGVKTFAAGTFSPADILAADSSLAITGLPAAGAGAGGEIIITGGITATGTSGALTLKSGGTTGAGTAGDVILDSGATVAGTNGVVRIGSTNAIGIAIGNIGASIELKADLGRYSFFDAGENHFVTLVFDDVAAIRDLHVPAITGTDTLMTLAFAQTVTAAKTFTSSMLLLQEAAGADVITVAVAALAAGLTYTVPDAGGAASFCMLLAGQTTPGRLVRADLSQETVTVTINLNNCRVWDAPVTLPPSGVGTNDDIGVIYATFGTALPELSSKNYSGLGADTSYTGLRYVLPDEYVAGQDFVIRVNSGMLTGVAATSAFVDLNVYRQVTTEFAQNTVGADLCATAQIDTNALYSGGIAPAGNHDFTITGASLLPGDTLDIRLAFIVDNNSVVANVFVRVYSVKSLLPVKG